MNPTHSTPCRLRVLTALALAGLAISAHADRVLVFAARERADGPVFVGEVTGAGLVVLRLRSKAGSVLSRAQAAAAALQEATLTDLTPPPLTTEKAADGQFVLKARGQTVATADKETAAISGLTSEALATSWAKTVAAAFQEPYLVLDGEEPLVVPVEEARYMRFGGPLGKTLAASAESADILALKVEPTERRIKLYGAGPGASTVTLASGTTALTLTVIAKYWAARIADAATAELSGSGQDEALAKKVATNAALAGAVPQPGATLAVTAAERTGSEFQVAVLASGPDYLDAKRQVRVALKWVASPQREPVDLLISNAPERIFGPGCLMREQLLSSGSERILYHHVNASGRKLMFVVRIANAGREAAALHVVLGEAGPGGDELGVGHSATLRYWDQSRTGSGYVLRIPPMSASDIVRTVVQPDAIVSGLGQVTTLSASPLFLEVQTELPRPSTETMWVEPLDPNEYAEPRLTTFRFGARKTVELQHEVAGQWTFYSLGADGSTNEHGTHLAGDYGVLHEMDLEVTNPHDSPGWFEVHVRASGGVMRGLFLINGVLHETGLLRGSMQERLAKEDIPAGSTRRVRIEAIPESASNYPVHIVVHSQLRD